MRFWDSSAVLPLVVREPSSSVMAALLREDPDVVLWWGTPVECVSALGRANREQRLGASMEQSGPRLIEALRDRAFEIQPVEDVRRQAIRLLSVYRLRAADALQLAAALTWCGERPARAGFVCLDARLSDGARREGFDVLP